MQHPTKNRITSLQNIIEEEHPIPNQRFPRQSRDGRMWHNGSYQQLSRYHNLRHTVQIRDYGEGCSMQATKSHPNIAQVANQIKIMLKDVRNLPLPYSLAIIVQVIKYYSSVRYLGWLAFDALAIRENCSITVQNCNGSINRLGGNRDQHGFVSQLVQRMRGISDSLSYEDFYTYYKRVEKKNTCTFKYVLMLIQSYCLCAKIQLNYCFSLAPYVIKQEKQGQACLQRASSSIGNQNFQRMSSPSIKAPSIRFVDFHKRTNQKRNTTKSQRLLQNNSFTNNSCKFLHSQKQLKPQKNNHKIQTQFQIKIKSQQNIINIKQSTVSTNFKTSAQHDETKIDNFDLSFTFNCRNGGILTLPQNSKFQDKEWNRNFGGENNVEQVQSQYQSSSQDEGKKCIPLLKLSENSKKAQNQQQQQQALISLRCNQIIESNRWKMKNIFTQNRSISQSITSGKEEQKNERQPPKNLDKLARILTEST